MPFALPDNDVIAAIDAAPTPLAAPSPSEQFVVLVHYEAHPPIGMLARPWLGLAGVRIDPAIRARQRTRRFTGLSVLALADGAERALAVPEGAQVSVPTWAPDGRRFAFTVDEADGVGVWVGDVTGDAVQVPGLRASDVLGADPPGLGGTVRWSRDGGSLLVLGARAGRPATASGDVAPRIAETAGKRSQMATYQDLLEGPADEDRFEDLATTIPLRVDPACTSRWTSRPTGGTCSCTGCGGRSRSGCRTSISRAAPKHGQAPGPSGSSPISG